MTTNLTLTDLVIMASVITTSVVTIINAFFSARRGKVLSSVSEKADAAVTAAELVTTNAASAAKNVAALAVAAAKDVAAVVKARSDSQDQKLDEIHEATNGGVQALRDRVVVGQDRIAALEQLLKTALAELQAERAKR